MASITFDLVQLAAIVGALQGLFLTGVLAAQRGNRTANRLLAALMAAMTIYLAWGPYYTAGIIRVYPHLFAVNYLTTWVFGPLVYLYARAASDRSWRPARREFLHFVPVAIVFMLATPLYAMSGPEKIAMWDRWAAQGLTPPLRYVDPLKYILGVSYTTATMLYLRRHRRDVEHSYSNVERVNLRWLLQFSAATLAIWLLATGLRVSNVSTSLRDGHITFAMAMLMYGVGYMGLRQPEIFRRAAELPIAAAPAVRTALPPDEPEAPAPPIPRSILGDEEAELLRTALLAMMEHQEPWRDSELTLYDLAARLDTTPHKLSELLNAWMGETFYDFVNSYRVRDVQRRIKAGEARSLKILALAMDAGFASKSTFNEVFKRHTRQTPSEFRQAACA